MWQVVSGTANLLSDRAVQAVVPTITSQHRDEGHAVLAESARAVSAAGSSSNVPEDERGAGLITRLSGPEMSMEGHDAE
jgi:hypothetical protein